MSNVAVIFAGGVGQRMNTKTMPKQFLELHQKPIIIYTLEVFDKHPEIDGIVISCVAGWQEYLNSLIDKFRIRKVKAVVSGGETGQISIRNGVYKAHELYEEDSIVLIHDGVRPLIDQESISRNIACVKANGNAVMAAAAVETIATQESGEEKAEDIFERSRCRMLRAPQSFLMKDIYETHKKAEAEGKNDFIDSACLMRAYGYPIYTVEGSPENIKITTPMDFYIFRAIIDARENGQIFG